MSVFEIRVVFTTDEYDKLVAFYRDGLGLDSGDMWTDHGRGQLLNGGRGVVEILDTDHSAMVDRIEGGQTKLGQIRLAFEVPDIHIALKNAVEHGAQLLHEPIMTSWNDLNARIISPDGVLMTLFQHM